MSKLLLRLLGTFSVAPENGTEIVLTRKNKIVLAAIALAGPEGLSRDKLVDLLWQERGEEQARASLRQALAATGKGLGPHRDCLRAGPDRVAIDEAMIEFDVREFETLASSDAVEDWDRAIELYRGDLLDGVSLKEDGFEAWLRPVRERLRTKAVNLLERCLASPCGAERSVDIASHLLELEPANEAAHRALMRTYALQGRDAAALKQFTACRDLLSQELGVGPSHETTALYQEIRHRQMARRHSRAGSGIVTATPAEVIKQESRPMTKPTITVKQFENLSDEPGQDYFAAGITNDITSALVRHRWLSVVSLINMIEAERYSIMSDGKIIQSNVDYMVTGNVRKAGNRLRISVQMIDAHSGEVIWSENYDRQLGDIFQVQDEITGTIAGHIDIEIGASERRRALRRSTENMGAWDCYHLGMAHFAKFTREDFLEARRLFARSLEFDPEFGEGHAWWSFTNVMSTFYFDVEPTTQLLDQALKVSQRAVEIDERNAVFHLLLGRVHLAQREYTKCMTEMETAIELNPNLSAIYCGMGDSLNYEGQYHEAIEHFDKSIKLGPRDPMQWAYIGYGALTHLFAEDFETALDWSAKAIRNPRCKYWPYAHRVAALGHWKKGEEVRNATDQLLLLEPTFSCRMAQKKLYFVKRPEQLQLYLDGLRKAGVPE